MVTLNKKKKTWDNLDKQIQIFTGKNTITGKFKTFNKINKDNH